MEEKTEKTKESFELTAQEAIEILERQMQATKQGAKKGKKEIIGAIYDQDEAIKFLEWLTNPKRRQQ
jgi:hypothetical protein